MKGIREVDFVGTEFAGTRGQERRLEAFWLDFDPPLPDGGFQYMAYCENIGEMPWVDAPAWAGTRDEGLRLEGFAIRLTGTPDALETHDVFYSAWVQDLKVVGPVGGGLYCGTKGQSRRVEGIEVSVVISNL